MHYFAVYLALNRINSIIYSAKRSVYIKILLYAHQKTQAYKWGLFSKFLLYTQIGVCIAKFCYMHQQMRARRVVGLLTLNAPTAPSASTTPPHGGRAFLFF